MIQPSKAHPLGETISRWASVILLLGLTAVSLYASGIISVYIWGDAIHLRFGITYLSYSIILLTSVFSVDCLNFGGKRLHMLAYGVVISIAIAGVATLALPYFIIGKVRTLRTKASGCERRARE